MPITRPFHFRCDPFAGQANPNAAEKSTESQVLFLWQIPPGALLRSMVEFCNYTLSPVDRAQYDYLHRPSRKSFQLRHHV